MEKNDGSAIDDITEKAESLNDGSQAKRKRGRPRGRRVPIVPEIMAEMPITTEDQDSCEILSVLDLGNDGLDERWRKLPERPLAVLVLRALGLSTRAIGRAVGISQPTVRQYCNIYDPERIFVLSPDQRDIIASSRWNQHENQLLTAAGERQDELSAMDLYRAAGIARDKQLKSRQVKTEERQPAGAFIGRLRQLVSDNNSDTP